jgi:Tfp pilus assembly protein PilO
MKKNLVMLMILLIFGGGFWVYYNMVYLEKPRTIRRLDRQIRQKNEELISAQIIAKELDLVAKLIDRNLAQSARDSLAEDASMPFMEDVATMLDDLGIVLLNIKPGRRVNMIDYIKTPYELKINASYKQFLDFINTLEKSERLVTLEEFEIDNGIRKAEKARERRAGHNAQNITLKISTLTLLKHTS